MKTRLLRHFETQDAVLGQIVPISKQYDLHLALRKRPSASVYEALARSIANQQLSGVAAAKILGRLVAAYQHRFPPPAEILRATPASLRAVGFSFAKIAALQDLAAHSLDGRLPDDEALAQMDDETIISHCTAVRGIGRWTVQMLLMFHFGRPDVLPIDDYGVRNGFRLAYGLKGLPRPRSLGKFGERWRPFRSAAAWYLWRAVELHQQGTLPVRRGRAPRIEIVKLPA